MNVKVAYVEFLFFAVEVIGGALAVKPQGQQVRDGTAAEQHGVIRRPQFQPPIQVQRESQSPGVGPIRLLLETGPLPCHPIGFSRLAEANINVVVLQSRDLRRRFQGQHTGLRVHRRTEDLRGGRGRYFRLFHLFSIVQPGRQISVFPPQFLQLSVLLCPKDTQNTAAEDRRQADTVPFQKLHIRPPVSFFRPPASAGASPAPGSPRRLPGRCSPAADIPARGAWCGPRRRGNSGTPSPWPVHPPGGRR